MNSVRLDRRSGRRVRRTSCEVVERRSRLTLPSVVYGVTVRCVVVISLPVFRPCYQHRWHARRW